MVDCKTLKNLHKDEMNAHDDYKEKAKSHPKFFKRMSKDEKRHAKNIEKMAKTELKGCKI